MIDLQNTLFNYRLISTTLETERERTSKRGGERDIERDKERCWLQADDQNDDIKVFLFTPIVSCTAGFS